MPEKKKEKENNDGKSKSFVKPWLPAASLEPCLRWTCEQSALYVPSAKMRCHSLSNTIPSNFTSKKVSIHNFILFLFGSF